MIKKYKFYIITAVVVVLAVAIVMSGSRELDNELFEQESGILPGTEEEGTLYGFLEVSDNKELGNYKLVTEVGDIYIRTSRDYGDLTGSQVRVSIDGIPESFRLIDIYVNPQ